MNQETLVTLHRLRHLGEWKPVFYIDQEDALSSLSDKDNWTAARKIARNDAVISSLRWAQLVLALLSVYALFRDVAFLDRLPLFFLLTFCCQLTWGFIVIRAEQLARGYPLFQQALLGQVVRIVPVALLFSAIPSSVIGVTLWFLLPVSFRVGHFRKNTSNAELNIAKPQQMNSGIMVIGRLFHYSLFWLAAHRRYGLPRLTLFSKMLIARRVDIFDSFEHDIRYRVAPVALAIMFMLLLQLALKLFIEVDTDYLTFNLTLPMVLTLIPILALHCSTIGMIWMPLVAAEYATASDLAQEPVLPDSERMTPEEQKSARRYMLGQQARMVLCLGALMAAAIKFLYV